MCESLARYWSQQMERKPEWQWFEVFLAHMSRERTSIARAIAHPGEQRADATAEEEDDEEEEEEDDEVEGEQEL